MAWTPITACFLGQIAYGRTVREFMLVNFILPALFGAAWMAIFSGTALHLEMNAGADFEALLALDENGKRYPARVAYDLFEYLPMTFVLVVFYICSTFCLLYTSPSPRDATLSRMPSSA